MRQQDDTTTLDFQYDASGTAIGLIYNGTPYFYLRNLQGDVVSIADKNGDLVVNYIYDAWGQVTASNPSMIWGAPIHPVGLANPIRYRGYYYDNETGWYWLQTRDYNPEWKRFINADCMFIAGNALTGANMYAYCDGNPVMYVDPSGMASKYGWDVLGTVLLIYAAIEKMYVTLGMSLEQIESFWMGIDASFLVSTANTVIRKVQEGFKLVFAPDGGIFNRFQYIPPSKALESIPIAIENLKKAVFKAGGILAVLGSGLAIGEIGISGLISAGLGLLSKPLGPQAFQLKLFDRAMDWFTSNATAPLLEWARKGAGYVMAGVGNILFFEWSSRGDFGFGVFPWIWVRR